MEMKTCTNHCALYPPGDWCIGCRHYEEGNMDNQNTQAKIDRLFTNFSAFLIEQMHKSG